MSSWGFGSAIRAFSTRLFSDDLAGELEPSIAPASVGQGTLVPPFIENSGPVHVRSFPEHQVARKPVALSPDQLQQSMKQLMRYPKLWTMYKEELSMQDHPTHPETVRQVLIDFLEKHGQEMIPTPTKPLSNSIFQGWNIGLEEESTHVSRTRPAPTFPEKQQDDLQSRMKRLMKHSELWARYKHLLSQQERPDDPDTIRRLLVVFWKEHEEKIIQLEGSQIHDWPSHPSFTKQKQRSSSIFQALNTDLDGESQHVLSSNLASRRISPMVTSKQPSQDTTHRQLRLLRSSPALYAKYQERLLMDESEEDTPAADLLTKFLEEHKSELTELDQADQDAKRLEAQEASLLHIETATFAEEEAKSKFTRTTVPDRRQKFTVYRDSISSQSMRGVQEAIESLAGETTIDDSSVHSKTSNAPQSSNPSIKDRPSSLSSQSEHPGLSKDRRQKFMAYRDSISSRSVRGVQEVIEALAGEASSDASLKADVSSSKANEREGDSTSGMGMPFVSASVGDMHSTIASLVAWGQAFPLENVSNFVTHEMENMTSELKGSNKVSICRSQTTEDLDLNFKAMSATAAGPLHSSLPTMSFNMKMIEEDDDEDHMLQQAAKIAIRHRLLNARNGAVLESIVDEGEEDKPDTVSVLGLGRGSSKGPIMAFSRGKQDGEPAKNGGKDDFLPDEYKDDDSLI